MLIADSLGHLMMPKFLPTHLYAVSSEMEHCPQIPKSLVPGYDKVPNYLVEEPAYPLTPTCMKEYESCKNNAEVIFNTTLRSTRNPIECAFGRLKAR